MISMFEGKIGGGKTYNAVRLIVSRLALGHAVFTNIELNLEAIREYLERVYSVVFQDGQLTALRQEGMDNFQNEITTDCLVVIDEAHIWFNSRDWAKTSRRLLNWLTQSRKFRCDVVFISQSQANVDKQFSRLIQFIHRYRDMALFHVLPGFKPINRFCESVFDSDGRTRMFRRFIKKDPEIFKLYSTLAILDDSTMELGRKFEVKKVEKKKVSKRMKVIIGLVGVLFIGLVVLAFFKIGDLTRPHKVEAHSGSRSVGASENAKSLKPSEAESGVHPDFYGARYVAQRGDVSVYRDRFRIITVGEIDTSDYRFIKGTTSACGEVLGASESGIMVKDWSGRRVLIVRDYTPDPPLELTELQRDGIRGPTYGTVRNQSRQETNVGPSQEK